MSSQKLTNIKIKLDNFNFMFFDVENHFCCLSCLSCIIILRCCISIGDDGDDGVASVDGANDVNCDQANCNDELYHHQIQKQYVFVLYFVSILVQGLYYQFFVISLLFLCFVSTEGYHLFLLINKAMDDVINVMSWYVIIMNQNSNTTMMRCDTLKYGI